MSIEVIHNIDSLPAKATLRVRNAYRAYKSLEAFMVERQPRGLRVRHSCDLPTSKIMLEARGSLQIATVIQHLRAGGFIREITNRR